MNVAIVLHSKKNICIFDFGRDGVIPALHKGLLNKDNPLWQKSFLFEQPVGVFDVFSCIGAGSLNQNCLPVHPQLLRPPGKDHSLTLLPGLGEVALPAAEEDSGSKAFPGIVVIFKSLNMSLLYFPI